MVKSLDEAARALAAAPVRTVGVLPFGLDGLFMRRAARAAGFRYLVEAGSADERWVRRFVPAEAIVRFRLRAPLPPSPTTLDLVRASDLGATCARAGIAHLLLDVGRSAALEAWARSHRLTWLAPGVAHRALEDKLVFHRLLARLGLPQPEGGPVTLDAARRLDLAAGWVLQEPTSAGGVGTFFVDAPADLDALAARGALVSGERYLARRRVAGRPLGVTLAVLPGLVALSAARLQCYFPRDPSVRAAEFAGLQWLPTASLGPRVASRLERVLLRLGHALHRRRYVGLANIDLMLEDRTDRVLLLECNARMAASSPQLFHHPELASGLDLADLLLAAFARRVPWPARGKTFGLPDAPFEGATLDVLAGVALDDDDAALDFPDRVGPTPASGVVALADLARAPSHGAWRPRPDPASLAAGEVFVHFPRRPGDPLEAGTLLASALSEAPLFSSDGRPTELACALTKRLRGLALG